jgi:hypothetical protein
MFTGPNTITNGLVLSLDAANVKSYVSGSTTWRDLSGNNNSGSLVNGPTFSSANGGSIVFDGVDDFASFGNFAASSLPNGSISSWVKLASGGLTFQVIAAKRTAGDAPGFDYELDLSSTGRNIRGLVSNGSSFNAITGNTTLLFDVWYLLTFTWNGSALNIYLNDISDATQITQTVSVSSLSTKPFDIGVGRETSVAQRYYKGNISSTLLYNRALSSQEVLQNYNSQKSRFGL